MRHPLNQDAVFELGDDLFEDLAANVGMGQLASPEPDRYLDLFAVLDESLDRLGLKIEVVIVRLGPEAHFFQQDDLLVLSRFAVFLFLLVLETAVVQEAAYGRGGGGCHFDEVKAPLACDANCIGSIDDSELFPVLADQADLRNSDPFVNS